MTICREKKRKDDKKLAIDIEELKEYLTRFLIYCNTNINLGKAKIIRSLKC